MTALRGAAARHRATRRDGLAGPRPPPWLLNAAALLGLELPGAPRGTELLQGKEPAGLGLAQGRAQLALGLSEEAGTSELDRVLPDIDAHWAAGLNLKRWKPGECTSIARRISVVGLGRAAPARRGHRRSVHTAMILREDSGLGSLQGELVGRKLRFAIMSFLATQDLSRTRLRIWVDTDTSAMRQVLNTALEPILRRQDLSRSVQVHHFNASREFAEVSPNSGELLLSLYNSVDSQQLAVKSDLVRACILYNHGGAWLDSDVLLIQDLSPLLGRDWAYLGEKDLINNAVLSTSGPRSLFASSFLLTLVQQNLAPNGSTSYFRYGASILRQLYDEEWTRRTFHVLPPCFFDGTWSREKGVGETQNPWDDLFSLSLAQSTDMKRELTLLYPLNDGHEFFAYHWHGRWKEPFANHSLAWALERIYWAKLNLSGDP